MNLIEFKSKIDTINNEDEALSFWKESFPNNCILSSLIVFEKFPNSFIYKRYGIEGDYYKVSSEEFKNIISCYRDDFRIKVAIYCYFNQIDKTIDCCIDKAIEEGKNTPYFYRDIAIKYIKHSEWVMAKDRFLKNDKFSKTFDLSFIESDFVKDYGSITKFYNWAGTNCSILSINGGKFWKKLNNNLDRIYVYKLNKEIFYSFDVSDVINSINIIAKFIDHNIVDQCFIQHFINKKVPFDKLFEIAYKIENLKNKNYFINVINEFSEYNKKNDWAYINLYINSTHESTKKIILNYLVKNGFNTDNLIFI